ncbi:glutamine-synthetase adenylyltransferase [Nereida sp. MMG025]|uniref:[protein-PII] uridylyltransferase family protein n=1 Tax=Nereida sp. MMG025 TaxID=2909981 RepID=UPI001F246531|nr:glutamine-synthetase adenylyltransferase [Nereida sp. MMG025]MCF6443566.1 glutamine-synthetase adenylyltransferase [Nereida sp. MMG025]
MTFASRITRSPIAYDPDIGADAAALFPELDRGILQVIEGAAGCSPYLKSLMSKEATWLTAAFGDPEQHLAAELADLSAVPLAEMPARMRQAKRRVAVLAGLADLAGVWPLETVTRALTDLADRCLQVGLSALLQAEAARGKLPMLTADDLAVDGGMVFLAMGKMGAYELNYSSDIDMICLFDDSRYAREDLPEIRSVFVRVTRKLMQMIGDVTRDGYVFRTDLRLRPDASVTPVCISMAAAELYYEAEGRTWERAAHIKARPCAGDLVAGQVYLDRLRPFVWRKHLDFAAIQDAHDMRQKIWAHKGLSGPITLPEHNVKLGRGGIREIEFYTQTRQLIAGGRDADLRVNGTLVGLDVLTRKGWTDETVSRDLKNHYRVLREVEHRLQMIGDAQTHSLPKSDDGFDRLAAFMGVTTADLKADLIARFEAVHSLTDDFFAPNAPEPASAVPEFGEEILARWPSYPALRSSRATEIFNRLRPDILRKLARAARPEEALLQFDGFLRGLPAGVQLFSLFEANPPLVDLLVDICATSPALAQYLGRNSSVLDGVLAGHFFAPWPGLDALRDQLSQDLTAQTDYEVALGLARRFKKEWHFRIGVHHLRGLITAAEAGQHYADLAEAIIASLWPVAVDEFAKKHGAPMGRGALPIGMGSLGAGRLTATSDLDLIVIYDAQGVEASDGPRELSTRPYFARLTQAFITALTAQLPEGRLYEVDMRLRPSGRQGPVATSWAAYQDYQCNEAWTWEHLALTRARALHATDLSSDWQAARQTVLHLDRPLATRVADVQDMRKRLADAKPVQSVWDITRGAGGLQDIELFGQTIALVSGATSVDTLAQLQAGVAIGWLSAVELQDLCNAYSLFWTVKVTSKLLNEGAFDPSEIGQGGCAMMMRETAQTTLDALADELMSQRSKTAAIIEAKYTSAANRSQKDD